MVGTFSVYPLSHINFGYVTVSLTTAFKNILFSAQTQNYSVTELPLKDDCQDPNAEKRLDNSSCTLTCHKLSINENPGTL